MLTRLQPFPDRIDGRDRDDHDDHDGDWTRISIADHLPTEARPFRCAVAAYPARHGASRAIGVWRSAIGALFAAVADEWAHGVSRDPYDGTPAMLLGASPPFVAVELDAPPSSPDPMHVRSAVHLAEGLRASMRREAAVSTAELDRVIGDAATDAIARFPVDAANDPARAAAALERLRTRHATRRR